MRSSTHPSASQSSGYRSANDRNPGGRPRARHQYGRLSPSQRRVIDHLLADTRYAAVISGPELARTLEVSESTVTRAAQTLGFSGFPDLQAHLRDFFVGGVSERVAMALHELGDSPADAAIRVMLEDAERVRHTAEDLAPRVPRRRPENAGRGPAYLHLRLARLIWLGVDARDRIAADPTRRARLEPNCRRSRGPVDFPRRARRTRRHESPPCRPSDRGRTTTCAANRSAGPWSSPTIARA